MNSAHDKTIKRSIFLIVSQSPSYIEIFFKNLLFKCYLSKTSLYKESLTKDEDHLQTGLLR